MFISLFREYYVKIVVEGSPDIHFRIIRNVLYLLSKIYGFVVKTRIFFYKEGIFKSIHLPIPVISVGNITTGGTGKTPTVEYISRYLQERNKRVVILSRGYAANLQQEHNFPANKACNDEYLLLKENIPDIPNLLSKDRIKSGLEAIRRFKAEYVVLDDGFQHLRLARDLNIVIIDTLNPFGYEHMVPRGMLREPLKELRRADMIILTHADQCTPDKIRFIVDRLHEFAGYIPVIETIHKPTYLESVKDAKLLDINYLKGKRVFAFCAIGNPLSFRKSIEGLGAELLGLRIFPDHHHYTSSELIALNKEMGGIQPDAIIITQKDKVKIRDNSDIWDFPLWTLKMEICIVKGYEIFENKINTILN